MFRLSFLRVVCRHLCLPVFAFVLAGAVPAVAPQAFAAELPDAELASLPDPTRPPDPHQEQQPVVPDVSAHNLSSIIFGPKRRVAVINGKVVTEGGLIDGATVVQIEQGQVWLQLADKSRRAVSLGDSVNAAAAKPPPLKELAGGVDVGPLDEVTMD